MKNDPSILFKEGQQVGRLLLAAIIFIMLAAFGIIIMFANGEQNPKSEVVLTIIAVLTFEIPLFVLFYYTKLETIVNTEGIGYRWWPLQRKFRMLFKDDIEQIQIRKSPAFTYGIHWLPGYGWVNNMKGRKGIQIRLKRGKRIYIGTQKLDELRTAVEKIFGKRIDEIRNEF